jgi:hypothetical protein
MEEKRGEERVGNIATLEYISVRFALTLEDRGHTLPD